jgi:hypothetical protein
MGTRCGYQTLRNLGQTWVTRGTTGLLGVWGDQPPERAHRER